jgi:4-amino-4-deoxy-L-arabinose transferase-like glycosyltransferase
MSMKWVPLIGISLIAGAVLALTLLYRLEEPDIPDSIGYIQASHQLARGKGLAFVDLHNQVGHRYYTLYAFKVIHSGTPHRYFSLPPGAPVLAAVAEMVTGHPGTVHTLGPVLAAVLVAVTYFIGKLLFDAWTGLWAALALALSPTLLQFSSSFWSETPSAAFLYLGYALGAIALLRARDDLKAVSLAGAAGLIIGFTFFLRFSNVSVLPALPALIGMIGGTAGFKQRRGIALAVSTLLALLSLFVFNTLYYGNPFLTGYSPHHGWYNQPAFSWTYAFGRSFVNGHSTPALGMTLVRDLGGLLLFGLAGIAARPRAMGVGLLVLALALLFPYSIYAFSAVGVNARFIIPALPALCLLIGHGITTVGNHLPDRIWRWVPGGMLLAILLSGLPGKATLLETRNRAAQANIQRTVTLIAPTEPNAVVLSYTLNDLIAVYGHRSVLNYRHIPPYDPVAGEYQYDRLECLLVEEVKRLLNLGVPVYYILDGSPPLFHSNEILRRHFILSSDGTLLHRVKLPPK